MRAAQACRSIVASLAAVSVAMSAALPFSFPTTALATRIGELRDEVAQTRSEIDDLHARAEEAGEALERTGEELARLDGERSDIEERLGQAREDLARETRAGYKSGLPGSLLDALMSCRTLDDLVVSLRYSVAVRDSMSDRVDAVRTDRDRLASLQEEVRQTESRQAKERGELDRRVAELEERLAGLTDSLRSEVTSAAGSSSADAATIYDAAMVEVGDDAARRAAIDAAFSQIGVPYGYGSYSPGSSLDCSGLIMYAYSKAGVSLPHSSVAQSGVATHKSLEDLLPGDLLFWVGTSSNSGSGSHVAMYLGNGKMIHASWEGVIVQGVYGGWNACGSVV